LRSTTDRQHWYLTLPPASPSSLVPKFFPKFHIAPIDTHIHLEYTDGMTLKGHYYRRKQPAGLRVKGSGNTDNHKYLQEMEQRKMSRPILDAIGQPVGGNNQPQGQQGGFDPRGLFLQIFDRTLAQITQARASSPMEAVVVVKEAADIAQEFLKTLGFRFFAPMSAEVIIRKEPAGEEPKIETL
jgi:hypothetical protein